MRGRDPRLLMVSLGIDNFGSGMFLPLTLVYITRVIGLPLGLVGVLVSAGSLIGLLVPLFAGRIVDHLGPRTIVIAAQLLQLVGMIVYLIARGPVTVFLAAVLVACGSQLFYSSLFTYIGVIAPPGPKDHFFALIDMVRSACFGLGSLIAGVALAVGQGAITAVVVVDAVTFALAALLGCFIAAGRVPGNRNREQPPAPAGVRETDGLKGARSVWRDAPFLLLTVATGMIVFATDFFLVGFPVFALEHLHVAGWVPGICVTVVTVASSLAMTWVVKLTRGFSRTSVIAAGAGVAVIWAILVMISAATPEGWRQAWLIGATVVLAASVLLVGTRPNVLAESRAPQGAKGSYLSVFQFGFAIATTVAPLLAAGFAVSEVLPWVVVAALSLTGGILVRSLASRLEHRG
jgi:MFS family permease